MLRSTNLSGSIWQTWCFFSLFVIPRIGSCCYRNLVAANTQNMWVWLNGRVRNVGPNIPTVYSCEFDGVRRTIATQTFKETETKACSPDSAIDSPGLHCSVWLPPFSCFVKPISVLFRGDSSCSFLLLCSQHSLNVTFNLMNQVFCCKSFKCLNIGKFAAGIIRLHLLITGCNLACPSQ